MLYSFWHNLSTLYVTLYKWDFFFSSLVYIENLLRLHNLCVNPRKILAPTRFNFYLFFLAPYQFASHRVIVYNYPWQSIWTFLAIVNRENKRIYTEPFDPVTDLVKANSEFVLVKLRKKSAAEIQFILYVLRTMYGKQMIVN